MQTLPHPPSLPVQAPKTYPKVARILDTVMDVCLHGAVLTIPLLFTSVSLDSLELVKQSLLILFATVAILAWLGRSVATNTLTIHRNWMHVVVVLFVLGYGVLSWLSPDRYLSFVGVLGQMPWAFSTLVSLLALYFVAVDRISNISQLYNLVFTFLISSLLAGTYGILQMYGIHILPSAISKANTFSTLGSVFGLAVYLVVPLVISAGLAFHGCRLPAGQAGNNVCLLGAPSPLGKAARVVVWLTMIVSLAVLVLTDFWVAWVALLFGTALLLVLGKVRGFKVSHPAKFAVPAVLVVVSALLLWQPTPLKLNLPAEVSPSASASWTIAKQALRDHPVQGMGPGTWIYSYAKYRDRLVNTSPFWNVRFDRSFSQFLTLLASVGIVGTGLWLLLLASVVILSVRHLMKEKDDDVWYATATVFTGWATLTFLGFFYNYGMSMMFAWWLLLGILAALAGGQAWRWGSKDSKYAFEIITTKFVLCAVAGMVVLWLTGQRFMADAVFTQGVNAFRAGQPIEKIIPMLERAMKLNPLVDIYLRNLSQAHLIKAANLIQANPTQEQAATIQMEIKTAVDLGISGTTMNAANVDNFSNLAMLYQSIASFTRGADEFAINYYNKAIALEPANPVFIGEVGKLYLLRSDAYRTALDDKDPAKRAEAQKNLDENLKTAEQVLGRAIDMKPDYLPARYYLGIVYERQNKLKDAITQLATVLQQNKEDVGVGFELSILLYRDNQKQPALSLMEEVVRLDATNVNAKWYLSAMYEEAGRVDDALVQLRALAKQFPDNAAVQQRLTALEDQKGRTGTTTLPEPFVTPITGSSDTNPVTP